MNPSAPLLEFSGVAKSYGQRLLFRRVSAALLPSSISMLAGANGAGKSTLMRIAAGLAHPDAGIVTRNVSADSIGYMAHATFIYPSLDARENLLFWARAAGIPDPGHKADEALEKTGLRHCAHEKAGIFSRGMAQRLNLARLLLGAPRLILLDEPSTALDPESRAMLARLMLEARDRGAAILWISHNPEELSAVADRFFFLRDRTLEEGAAPC